MKKLIFFLFVIVFIWNVNATKLFNNRGYLVGKYVLIEGARKIIDAEGAEQLLETDYHAAGTELEITNFKKEGNKVFGRPKETNSWILLEENGKVYAEYWDLFGVYIFADSEKNNPIGVINIASKDQQRRNCKVEVYYSANQSTTQTIELNTKWHESPDEATFVEQYKQTGKIVKHPHVSSENNTHLFKISEDKKDVNWVILANPKTSNEQTYALYKILEEPIWDEEKDMVLQAMFKILQSKQAQFSGEKFQKKMSWIEKNLDNDFDSSKFKQTIDTFKKEERNKIDQPPKKEKRVIKPSKKKKIAIKKKVEVDKTISKNSNDILKNNWNPINQWPYILFVVLSFGGFGFYLYKKCFKELDEETDESEFDEENAEHQKSQRRSKSAPAPKSRSVSKLRSSSESASNSEFVLGSRELIPVNTIDIEKKVYGLWSESISRDIEFKNVPEQQQKPNHSESE